MTKRNKMKAFNNLVASAPQSVRNASEESDFRVICNAGDGDDKDSPVELLIMEQIGEDWYGDGVTATGVVEFLKEHANRDVHVRINSPGGLVYDGFVIFNALASHTGEVVVTIEGLAFSAASYIAMSGDTVRMFKASDIGIHRSATLAWGNRNELAATMEWLDKIDGHLVEIYKDRTGATDEQVNKWLDGTADGTLFNATEAMEHGFIDEIVDPKANKKKTDSKKPVSSGKTSDAVTRAGMKASRRTAARNRLRLQGLK